MLVLYKHGQRRWWVAAVAGRASRGKHKSLAMWQQHVLSHAITMSMAAHTALPLAFTAVHYSYKTSMGLSSLDATAHLHPHSYSHAAAADPCLCLHKTSVGSPSLDALLLTLLLTLLLLPLIIVCACIR